jgi:hypothetical protein
LRANGDRQSLIIVEQINSSARQQEAIMSSSDRPEQRPVVAARQARQGVTGHNVRYVLGFSIAAVIIVFGIIWLTYFT